MQDRLLEFWDEDDWKKIVARWTREVKRGFGQRLREVQLGGRPASNNKPLKGFAISVWEMWHRSGPRLIYTVDYAELTNRIYVLDAFEKDSRSGRKMRSDDKARIEKRIATLKREMDDLKARLRKRPQGLH